MHHHDFFISIPWYYMYCACLCACTLCTCACILQILLHFDTDIYCFETCGCVVKKKLQYIVYTVRSTPWTSGPEMDFLLIFRNLELCPRSLYVSTQIYLSSRWFLMICQFDWHKRCIMTWNRKFFFCIMTNQIWSRRNGLVRLVPLKYTVQISTYISFSFVNFYRKLYDYWF